MKNIWLPLFVGMVCLAPLSPVSSHAAGTDEFLIPRVAFSHLRIESGAWCEYLVIEESMEQTDSSLLYLSIPQDVKSKRAGFFWLELAGRPLDSVEEDGVIIRLLLSEEIKHVSQRDSLGNYVAIIYIKEGEEPVREGDYEALARLETASARDSVQWIPGEREQVETRAGSFSCNRYQRDLSFEKVIPAKGTKLIKVVSDHYTGWFAAEVPLFQMVRYTADRSRDTRMDPPIAGVPVAGARASKTGVELIRFGTGARTLLPVGE